MEWYVKVLQQYANFSGRARRKEYWMFTLFNLIIILVLSFIENLLGWSSILSNVYVLAVLVPSIAVSVRRLHDTGQQRLVGAAGLDSRAGSGCVDYFYAAGRGC